MARDRDATRLLNTMRNLQAQGWREESLLVDTAAEVIGGGDAARANAQRVFDKHLKPYVGA